MIKIEISRRKLPLLIMVLGICGRDFWGAVVDREGKNIFGLAEG